MMIKKKLAVMCSFLLTVSSIAYASASEKTEQYINTTIVPSDEIAETLKPGAEMGKVIITSDNENKYCAIGTSLTLSVKDLPEEETLYQWESFSDKEKVWTAIPGENNNTCKISVSSLGKLQYRCTVTTANSEKSVISNVITKIGYKNEVTVAVGDTLAESDLFGSQFSKLNGKVKFQCSKSESVLENKKNTLTVKCFSDKKFKVKWNITKGADKGTGGEFTLKIILPKEMTNEKLQKKASILITKNGTCLKVSYKDIKGVEAIKFQPEGVKINTVKLDGKSSKGSVTYNYRKKFKMKKFRVRFGYMEKGKKKLQYTKWFLVKDVKRK